MLRPKLNRIWTSASANLRRDPGDAKYIQGWVSEIPTFQVLNYLQYKIDTTLLAQAERGIFEWGTDIAYQLGSIVWCEADKKIYVAIVGAPDRTKSPNTNAAHWATSSIQVPRASYDAMVTAINAHIANVSNPHKLSAVQLGSYTKAETDALVAQYNALVAAHVADKNNPHKLTAAGVGAVPVTGGVYTGDVTFNGGVFFDAGKVNQISKSGGLFLQAGTAVLGIDSTGTAVAGTTASRSKLVTEATFPNLKAAREPRYAVPAEVYSLDFLGSVNIRRGVGTTASTGIEPTFDASLGYPLIRDNPVAPAPTNQILGDGNYNFAAITISAEVRLSSPEQPTDTADSLLIGMTESPVDNNNSRRMYIIVSGSNQIKLTRIYTLDGVSTSDTLSWQGPSSATPIWAKLVGTISGAQMRLYYNGVVVATSDVANKATAAITNTLRIACNQKATSALSRRFRLRNVKFWDGALTAMQVSTL